MFKFKFRNKIFAFQSENIIHCSLNVCLFGQIFQTIFTISPFYDCILSKDYLRNAEPDDDSLIIT